MQLSQLTCNSCAEDKHHWVAVTDIVGTAATTTLDVRCDILMLR